MVGCNYSLDLLNESISNEVTDVSAKSRIMHSHASLETVKTMLKENSLDNVEEIHLLHISSRNGDPERFKKEIQELTGKEVYV
jgi:phosphoribosyl 1,2-cyclic phosphodiesterase